MAKLVGDYRIKSKSSQGAHRLAPHRRAMLIIFRQFESHGLLILRRNASIIRWIFEDCVGTCSRSENVACKLRLSASPYSILLRQAAAKLSFDVAGSGNGIKQLAGCTPVARFGLRLPMLSPYLLGMLRLSEASNNIASRLQFASPFRCVARYQSSSAGW